MWIGIDKALEGIQMISKMYRLVPIILLCSFIAAACGGSKIPTDALPEYQTDPCGNGICDEGESTGNCPVDCPVEVEVEPTPTEEIDPLGYITFVVDVSDFIHLESSAAILLKLIDLFESNGVKGEFFLTGPMAHAFSETYPEVIQRIKESGMTISYSVQPPHPLIPGFQEPLQISAINLKEEAIANYETQRLNLTTGGLIEAELGGYQYLTDIFEGPPSAVAIPDDPIKGFALPNYAGMGAQMVDLYDELGPGVDQPFSQEYGMWVRPVDQTISHWSVSGIDASMAWWDMLATEFAASYQPLQHLQSKLESWDVERLPFTIISIDEYNFYREGPVPWTMMYYQGVGSTQAKSPPFNLDGPDLSSPRTPENAAAVWEAYVEVVEWAAKYTQVVTSADIVDLAAMGE
jgi:hypothetical protein